MIVLGISALTHDASVALIADGKVLFAAHAERYSRKKNDPHLNQALIDEALAYGTPDILAWNGNPWRKKAQQVIAGQYGLALSSSELPALYLKRFSFGRKSPELRCIDHHLAHAAAGFYTSPFSSATFLTADAIGDLDSLTVGEASGQAMRFIRKIRYPDSLGLLYAAFTQRCGLKPNRDEYILMAIAAMGKPIYVDQISRDFLRIHPDGFELLANVHRGIGNWMPDASLEDLAASIQWLTEEALLTIARWARKQLPSPNLVFMGGLALNCVANSRLAEQAGFDRLWIMPNPGDAGSSLGAAAAVLRTPLQWQGPYLGHDIQRDYDVKGAVQALLTRQMVGVANGKAEFGPRALGNRSLLADPRCPDIKDRINDVKGRERFRPLAPVVMEEMAEQFFDTRRRPSPYMQYAVPCLKPDYLPGVIHVDGSSRIQTVNEKQNPYLYSIVREFYSCTGCPALLNTSLNRKHEPLINSWEQAMDFSSATGVRVV